MRVSKGQISSARWDCSGDGHDLGYVILIHKERKVLEFLDFSIFHRFTKHLRRDGSYSPAATLESECSRCVHSGHTYLSLKRVDCFLHLLFEILGTLSIRNKW